MDYQEARLRLRNHANLPGTNLPITDSFLGGLWLFHRQEGALSLAAHTDDIITCLRAVNTHFNGPDPDNRSGRADHSRIHEVAYSISGIITGGLRQYLDWSGSSLVTENVLKEIGDSVLRISYAWDQVLAGDVSDILEGFDIWSSRGS